MHSRKTIDEVFPMLFLQGAALLMSPFVQDSAVLGLLGHYMPGNGNGVVAEIADQRNEMLRD